MRIVESGRMMRSTEECENVALWHERDISHSSVERIILPDSTILIDYLQHRAIALVEGLVVDAARMRENLELTHGALLSQRVLLALVETGRSREESYRIVQELSQQAAQQGTPLRELLAADARVREAALDLDAIFDHEHCTRHAEEIVARLEAIVALPARSS